MRTALTLKQHGTSSVPLPLPSQVLLRATSEDPVQLSSKLDQNQQPVQAAKRTAPKAGHTLKKCTVLTTANRCSQKSPIRVLTNGITKFPVWARNQKKSQPSAGEGITIQLSLSVEKVQTVVAQQPEMGEVQFHEYSDGEAAHGSSTSSGSTGNSDGSLSGDFEDKTDPKHTMLETKTLIRFFPITFPPTLL